MKKKVVVNLMLLVLISLPMLLIFDSSWFMKALAIWYGLETWKNIGCYIWKRYKEMKGMQG